MSEVTAPEDQAGRPPTRSPRTQRLVSGILRLALRAFGKSYQPSAEIPLTLVVRVLSQRAVWLARGLLKLHAVTFVGPRVRIRGKTHLSIGRGATIAEGATLDCYGAHGVVLGQRSKIGAMSVVSVTSHLSRMGEGFKMGHDSSFGEFSYIGASGGVEIGDDVIMGQYVTFHSQDHNCADLGRLIREQGTSEQGILIGHDCWIGARVTFLDGAVLGPHSIVAAGAVVKGTFPPYSIIGGVPAKQLKKRNAL